MIGLDLRDHFQPNQYYGSMIIGFAGLNYLSNLHEPLKYATSSFHLRYIEDG